MIWWADVVDDEDLARTYYAKLGYSLEETEGFISKARELGPAGGGLDLKAEGKHPPHIGEPEQHHGPRFQKATLWTPGAARFLGKNGMRPSPQFCESLGIRSQGTGSPQSGRFCLQILRRFLESQGRQQPGRAVVRSLDPRPHGLLPPYGAHVCHPRRLTSTTRSRNASASQQNGLGRVSGLIWSVLLSNPEREGLLKIQQLAAKRVGSQ